MTIVDSETLPPFHKDEEGDFVSSFIIKDKFAELYAEGIYPLTIYLTPTELVVVKNSGRSSAPVVVRRHVLREIAVSADPRVLNAIKVEGPLRTMLHYVYQLQSERRCVKEWLEAITKCKDAVQGQMVHLEEPFFSGAMDIGRSSPIHEFSSTVVVRERCVEGPASPSVEPGPYVPAAFTGYAPVIGSAKNGSLPRIRRRLLSAVALEGNYCTLPRSVEKRKREGDDEDAGRERERCTRDTEDEEDGGDAQRPSNESPTTPLDSPLRHQTIRRGRLYSRSVSSQAAASPVSAARTSTSPPPAVLELLPSRLVFKSKTLPCKKPSLSSTTSEMGYSLSNPKSPVARMVHNVHRFFSSPNDVQKQQHPDDNATDQDTCVPRKLHHYCARDVAEQLTEMDAKLMAKILPHEIENEAWTGKQKNEHAPNIMAMVQAFNRLALLIPTEILEETTPLGRAKVISKYIKIASECYRLHNYNSLKSVLAGLQCTPIYRLKETWKEVPKKRRRKFEQLCAIMSEENNWQLYREKLNKNCANDTPCIPFLGLFLTQIIQHGSYKVIRRSRELNKSSSFSSYSMYCARRLQTGRKSDSSLVSSRSVPSSPVPQGKNAARKKSLSGHFELNSGAAASDSSESAEDIVALKKAEVSNGSLDEGTPLSSHSWSMFSPDDLSDLGFVSQEPKSDPETISRSLELDDIRLSPKEDSPSVTFPTSPTMESVLSGTAPASHYLDDAKERTESPCGTMTEDSLTASNAFGSRPSLDSVFGNGCDDELRYEDIQCDIRSENSEFHSTNDNSNQNGRLPGAKRCSTPQNTLHRIMTWKRQGSRSSVKTEPQTANDPHELLELYKASALKCGSSLRCIDELQSFLREGGGAANSEKQNYKLSLEREPVHL